MASVPDSLLRDGIEALANVLPRGYTVALSGLNQPEFKGDTWVVFRYKAKPNVLCQVLARRRVEPRDLGPIAAHAARSPHPALLVSPYLPPTIRERLRGFGIGYCDLAGNVQLAIAALNLCIDQHGSANPIKGGERGTRSLCGEMAGRITRALVDLRPPYSLAELAEQARVEVSCGSRVVAYLAESGMIQRKPRGKIENVDWPEILRRWAQDAPLPSRGESVRFLASRGLSELLAQLGPSGFLHAMTGELAFAQLAGQPMPERMVMYVDDTAAATVQFGLHPVDDDVNPDAKDAAKGSANVVLVKPADRSVFHRSHEKDGIRYVSPSLMAADLEDEGALERVVAWMAKHESTWRR